MIRAVLFDLDETLVDRTETMRRFLLGQHARLSSLYSISEHQFAEACLRHQQNGYADKHRAYALACTELGLEGMSDELFADFQQRYGKQPVLLPQVLETLIALHKDYLIGLVSNGRTKGQTAKIEASGIAQFFSSVCISESVGSKKPDPRIFLQCLNELSVLPEEAVFVGDNPAADIEPAKALGMRAIWRKNEFFDEPATCDGVITAMAELPRLLKRW